MNEPLRVGDDAADAVAFLRGTAFMRRVFDDVDEATAGRALDSIRDALVSHETPKGVFLGGSAWLVSARS